MINSILLKNDFDVALVYILKFNEIHLVANIISFAS